MEMEDIPMAIPQWITRWIQQEDEEIEYTLQETVLVEPVYTVTRELDTTWLRRFEQYQDRDTDDTTV